MSGAAKTNGNMLPGITRQSGFVVIDPHVPGAPTDMEIRHGKLVAKVDDMWHIIDPHRLPEANDPWSLPDNPPTSSKA